MAEFYCKAVSSSHRDPIKDARGCYKRGDVVQVFADGGAGSVDDERFFVVRVPGLRALEAKIVDDLHVDRAKVDSVTGRFAPDAILSPSRWHVDEQHLTPAQRRTLETSRDITLSVDEFRAVMRDKATSRSLRDDARVGASSGARA